jgi:hypothetical protein
MLPDMKTDAAGSLMLYIQKASPGKDKEPNWLPAPNGTIYLVMRLYWPKDTPPSILPAGEGTWPPKRDVGALGRGSQGKETPAKRDFNTPAYPAEEAIYR